MQPKFNNHDNILLSSIIKVNQTIKNAASVIDRQWHNLTNVI